MNSRNSTLQRFLSRRNERTAWPLWVTSAVFRDVSDESGLPPTPQTLWRRNERALRAISEHASADAAGSIRPASSTRMRDPTR